MQVEISSFCFIVAKVPRPRHFLPPCFSQICRAHDRGKSTTARTSKKNETPLEYLRGEMNLFSAKEEPNAKDFAFRPGLCAGPLLGVRRIGVRNFAHVAQATRVEIFNGRGQNLPRHFFRGKPRLEHRLRKHREWPAPRRAIMVGGLAAGVFIACVGRAIKWMARIERANRP